MEASGAKEEEGMATAALASEAGEDPPRVTNASDATGQDTGKYNSDLSISVGCSTQRAAMGSSPSGCANVGRQTNQV